MSGLAVSLLLLIASPEPELTVDLLPGTAFVATWLGPAVLSGSGAFEGNLICFESPSALPVAGLAERDGDLMRLSMRLRYADVPPDWAGRWRPETGCALRVRLAGGGTVDWSAPLKLDPAPGSAQSEDGLISLSSLELIRLSDKVAEVRAVLTAANPFSFPLEIAAAQGDVRVRGSEIGAGAARGRTIRPRKKARFEIELRSDSQRFRAAAGDHWAVGAKVDSEVEAALAVRLPGGDLTFRVTLPGAMGTDGAREGVYALPEGATSLVPR